MKTLLDTTNEQSELINSTKDIFHQLASDISLGNEKAHDFIKLGDSMESQKKKLVQSIDNLAAIAEENAASTQQVSVTCSEQSNTFEELSNKGKQLANQAQTLNEATLRFKV